MWQSSMQMGASSVAAAGMNNHSTIAWRHMHLEKRCRTTLERNFTVNHMIVEATIPCCSRNRSAEPFETDDLHSLKHGIREPHRDLERRYPKHTPKMLSVEWTRKSAENL